MAPPPSASAPVIIIGAGISGLILAQHLKQHDVPFLIFERDENFNTRGIGWGLTLQWSLASVASLIPPKLYNRLPEAYVDRKAVSRGAASRFPFYDLSTGELKFATPKAPQSQRIRVTRGRLRGLLATGIDVQVRSPQVPELPQTHPGPPTGLGHDPEPRTPLLPYLHLPTPIRILGC